MTNPLRRMVSSGQVSDWFTSTPQTNIPSRFGGGYSLTLWTPAQITTQLWLDSDDPSTLTLVNGRVSQWNDKSGNSRNGTQSTEANRPRYWANRENGRAVLVLSANQWHSISYTISGTGWDFFAVASLESSSQSYARLISAKNAGQAEDWNNGTSWAAIERFDVGANIRSEHSSAATGNGAVTYNEANILHSSLTTGAQTFRINGTQTGTAATGSSLNTTDGIRVGGSWKSNAEKWAGILCEVLLVQAISTTNRDKVEGYLAHKWGLTAKLPSGHPYKTSPPTI